MRYSSAMLSAKDSISAPRRSWRKATFSVWGDLVRNTASCSCAQAPPSLARASKMASTLGLSKSRSISSRCAASGGRPGSASKVVRWVSTAAGSAITAAFSASICAAST